MAPGDAIVHRAHQVAAAIIAPFALMIGMFLIRGFHDAMVELVQGMTTGAAADTLTWLVHVLALGAFAATMVGLYYFVRNKGWGLFE